MRLDRQTGIERGGIALIEEALHLVRSAPPSCLVAYYLGSIPFVMTLLYFWADMSYSADAYLHCAPGALLVALAFVWMKAWQTVYARGLLAWVREEAPARWSLGRLVHLTATQALVHALGLLVLAPALVLAVPFLYVYGFLQNATILGDGEHQTLRALSQSAEHTQKQWPRQSFFIIWLLSPVLVVAALAFYLALMPVITLTVPEAWTLLYSLLFRLGLLVLCPLGFTVTLNIENSDGITPELARMFLGIQSTSLRAGLLYDNTLMSAVVRWRRVSPDGSWSRRPSSCAVSTANPAKPARTCGSRSGASSAWRAWRLSRALRCCGGWRPLHARSASPDAVSAAAPTVDAGSGSRHRRDPRTGDLSLAATACNARDAADDAAMGPFLRAIRLSTGCRNPPEGCQDGPGMPRWLIPDEPPDMSGRFGWLGGARFLLTVLLIILLVALVFLLFMLVVRSRRTEREEKNRDCRRGGRRAGRKRVRR